MLNLFKTSNRLVQSISPVLRANYHVHKDPIKVTDKAVVKLKELLKSNTGDNSMAIRLSTKKREHSGYSYSLNYVEKNSSVVKLDGKIEKNGLTLFIDNRSLSTITNTEMDYVDDEIVPEFVFNNIPDEQNVGYLRYK